MDLITLAVARKYTDDTVIGLGAIKGAPCTIQSITDNGDGTHTVTFAWEDTNGVTHTSAMIVSDGEDGKDGKDGKDGTNGVGIVSLSIDSAGHLIVLLTSGSSIDAGKVEGDDGFSPTVTVKTSTADEYILTITTADGWYDTPNLKGTPATVTIDDELSGVSENPVQNKVITGAIANKVDKVTGKGLSANDFTNGEKTKLSGIAAGAQVNVIESITVNGTEVVPVSKDVAITVMTNTVNNLTNYYLKTETYTKAEVDSLISTVSSMSLEIVAELPTHDISTTTIYLVPVAGQQNVYMQYAYINSAWAQLGTTQADFSNYYTKSQTDTLLTGKEDTLTFDATPTASSTNPVTSGGIYNALAGKEDTLTFDATPTQNSTNPVTSGGVYTALGNKQDTLTFDNTPTLGSSNPVTSEGIAAAVNDVDTEVGKRLEEINELPTAASTNLGKCYLLTAIQTGYVKGGIYQCQSDGELEPTYSWVLLSSDAKQTKSVTVTLAAASWTNNSQTVTVTGVLPDETKQLIQPVPASASRAEYESSGVKATAQAANSLTFVCNETPTNNLTVYVCITEVGAAT